MGVFAAKLAIDGEERLERMRAQSRRDIPRLKPCPAREGVVAVCGYGPSLRQTWKEIETPHVITTSGAHDFLIERGIIPKWHVEFEPRPHKAFFLQHPRSETTYCLASVCNDNLFEAVRGHKILLWHGLGGKPLEDCDVVIEAEQDDGILIKGGSTAGLRSVMIGHVLGFRKFALFGLDCSYSDDEIWAGPHSGAKHHTFLVEVNGKQFRTSDVMINAADELLKQFDDMPGCEIKVHGEHMFAERIKLPEAKRLARDWWKPIGWTPKLAPLFKEVEETDQLISNVSRKLNHQLHEANPDYGKFSARHAPQVRLLMKMVASADVLDYGCGKGELAKALEEISVHNYDPAIEQYQARPQPADIVVCTDTLEHVEPCSLRAVLRDLQRLTKRVLLVEIATFEASKRLADGRNAHLIVQKPEWWLSALADHFEFLHMPIVVQGSMKAICLPKAG